MAYLMAKLGVRFDTISPAGFHILSVLDQLASMPGAANLVITSGTDGEHSGLADPHKLGSAYDIRSQSFPGPDSKVVFIKQVIGLLGNAPPIEESGGWAGGKFWGWLEDADTTNEHFHVQLRKGETYP